MATLILRPNASRDFKHSMTNAGGSASGQINEATSDGDSTYIYQSISNTSDASVTSSFNFQPFPSTNVIINSGTLYAIGRFTSTSSGNTATLTLEAHCDNAVRTNDIAMYGSYTTHYIYLNDEVIAALNENLRNGRQPDFYATIKTTAKKGQSKNDDFQVRVTQVYLELDYTEAAAPGTECDFAVVASPGGSASVNPAHTTSGNAVTFTATPATNYNFEGWYSDPGYANLVNSNANYTITANDSLTLYAKFVKQTVNFGIGYPGGGGIMNVNWIKTLSAIAVDPDKMTDSLWNSLWNQDWDTVAASSAFVSRKSHSVATPGALGTNSSESKLDDFAVDKGSFVAFTGSYIQTSSSYSAFGMSQARFGYNNSLMPANQNNVDSTMRTGASFGTMPPSAWPNGLVAHRGDVSYIENIQANTKVYHFLGFVGANIIASHRPEMTQIRPAPVVSKIPNKLGFYTSSTDETTFEVGITDNRWVFEGFYADPDYTQLLSHSNPATLPTYDNFKSTTNALTVGGVNLGGGSSKKYYRNVYAKFTTSYPRVTCALSYGTGIESASIGGGSSIEVFSGDPLTCIVSGLSTGYEFAGWYINGSKVSTSTSYTFNPTANTEIIASAKPINYNVSVGGAQNGSANVSASVVPYSQTAAFTFTPDTGYQFDGWYTDSGYTNKISSNNPYTHTVTGNTVLYGKANPIVYDVGVGTSDLGTATVSASQAAYGTNVTFTFTPNEGVTQEMAWFSDAGLTNMVSVDNPYTHRVTGAITLYPGPKPSTATGLWIKLNGIQTHVNHVYKKVDGVYVEQTDVQSLFGDDKIYVWRTN